MVTIVEVFMATEDNRRRKAKAVKDLFDAYITAASSEQQPHRVM